MLINMTEGRPLKLMLPFMIPLLLGNVFQQLYNIADIIIVGRTIGVAALASVGAVAPVFMLQIGMTIGFSNGFAVVTGQRYGAKDMDGVRRSIATCLVLGVFMVLGIMLIMHLIIGGMLALMNVPAGLFENSRSYVMIISDGMAAMMSYNLLAAIMRSLGDSRTPLYFLIVSSVVNILLALLFIIKFGWGVPGSAVALVMAQALSAILCAIYSYVKFPELHIGRGDFRLTRHEMWQHLRMGLPMAIQFSVLGIGILFVQAVCNRFGPDTIAGFTTSMRIEQLATQPMITFGISMAVFTAQNFGARCFDRIRWAVRSCSMLSAIFAVCAAVLMFNFGPEIIGIFLDHPNEDVVAAAQMYISHTVPFYFVLSQTFVYRSAVQGMGISLIPMFSGMGELLMRSIAAAFLADIYGFLGVCLAQPFAWIFGAIFLFGSYHYFIRVLEKRSQLLR